MRKTVGFRLIPVVIFLAVASPPTAGHAFIKKLFGKKGPDRAPNQQEMSSQEQAATKLFESGQLSESLGKSKKARDYYEKAVTRYPLTKAAGEAQFRRAELYEKEGKISTAFNEYQAFIDTYRQSDKFALAIQRQYDIASSAKEGAKVKWLGIKRKFETSRIVEMLESVIANAPRSEFAPKAQFAIGETYEAGDDMAAATAAYQKVVDNYTDNPIASEAQLAIAKINFGEVEGGTNDPGDTAVAREAIEDILIFNPDSDSAAEARSMLGELDENSAAQSFNIAQFYEKRGNLKAAAIYYADVVKVPSSQHYDDARGRLSEIAVEEPEAVRDSPAGEETRGNALVVQAAEDVKGRDDYLGPPAPAIFNTRRKPKMRASSPIPEFPVEEPALPEAARSGLGLDDPIDGEKLLLPPPPEPEDGGEPDLNTDPIVPDLPVPPPPPPPSTDGDEETGDGS